MRGTERKTMFILAVLLLLGGACFAKWQEQQYQFPSKSILKQEETTDLSKQRIQTNSDFSLERTHGNSGGTTNYKEKTILVDESFTSQLPLVIIDTAAQKPKVGVVWDVDQKCYVPIAEDPYAYGEIRVINQKGHSNQVGDAAETKSLCKVKIRGNSSAHYDKKQYLVKLLDEKQNARKENLLGMGKDNEWILNVSLIDKSLLRNYLAYTTAGEIMPYTPDVQFCEVLWKQENGYRYEGVYLLMESVKAGKHRVDLPQYTENSSTTPALLRRDRYTPKGIMLDNYATKNALTPEYLDIEYPQKDVITEKGIQNITNQVNRFEEALYADTWEEFVRYRNYIDMGSFVDYFILNEFFLNYDAGYHSTYLYMGYSGKLTMGPVWDFDQAMDNCRTVPAILETTAFHSAPWFQQLLQDPIFTATILERYKELRSSILSDRAIQAFVSETVSYLGQAIERDWDRWGYYYENGAYLLPDPDTVANRNTTTYEEEIERMLQVLKEHGTWMDQHLDSLYQFKMCSLEDAQAFVMAQKKDFRPWMAVAFVAVFWISIRLVLKYESE